MNEQITGTEMDVGLQLMIMEAFDEEQACEHWLHDDPRQRRFHAGNAEWYFKTLCDSCGYSSPMSAVCDRYVKAVENRPTLKCRTCREAATHVILMKERIKQ